MDQRFRHSLVSLLVIFTLCGGLAPHVSAQGATPVASPVAQPSSPLDSTMSNVDLDVLVIGAHPDDEAFGLATYGQWNEYADAEVGVITVTRGEGGGNAVGTEEGPALGLLREREERNAVSAAGISHIYNLDKVDFYYTVSAPLTAQTWDYNDTLSRVVRVIRATTPDVIITMNPSPTPGNHGNHQLAARLAIDGYLAAADGTQFADDGFQPWSVDAIYQGGANGEESNGPDCATTFKPADPTDTVFGVWQGTPSERNGGRTWGEIARDGQRMYASQGWAGFPDAPSDPAEIGCDFYTLINSRVAISTNLDSPEAMLQNTVLQQDAGLPLDSALDINTDRYALAPGETVTASARASFPDGSCATQALEIAGPEGWSDSDGATPAASPVSDSAAGSATTTLKVPTDAAPGRYQITVTGTCDDATGTNLVLVEVVAPVTGVLAPLPEIAQFQEWASTSHVERLNSLIFPVTSIALGETESLAVNVTNHSTEPQSGTVSVTLPDGFEVESNDLAYADLAAGETTTVTFALTNTDASLATSNQGGTDGTYPITITTSSSLGTATSDAGLNLVPATVVPRAGSDIAVDGTATEGEYTGPSLDLSRVWEGDDPESAADASGSAQVAWTDDGIYVYVTVTDDTLGTVLTPEDAKRHWRTDSVEIAIDPLGTAPNTSATFKVGVFPTTTDGKPAAYRDADAHQGPVSETAPGFELASTVSEPYTGYTVETFIPFDDLPAPIDPAHATMNIFIYDSDTQDLTGQTRLGWSTWNGVQGDPYRWGQIQLAEDTGNGSPEPIPSVMATPEAVAVDAPIMPLDVALSTNSPDSIAQSAADGVPLAGMQPVVHGEGLTVKQAPTLAAGSIVGVFDSAQSGTAQVFVVDETGAVITSTTVDVPPGSTDVVLDGVTATGPLTMLVSFVTTNSEVQALAIPLG